jgi:adenine-specific DNA-methyltransferase
MLGVPMEMQLMLDVSVDRSLPTVLPPGGELGEVFTRRWVVELILDLAGYTADRDLAPLVAVEPSCGEGAFLGPMIERLLDSAATHGRPPGALGPALRAFDLSKLNVERAQKLAVSCLVDAGVAVAEAQALAEVWITCDDFLLAGPEEQSADFVIGNPPYIRLENVTRERSDAYRRACLTMRGRSDVYVGFIEKGLRLLSAGGALAFIVADRWMHNQYGADLRRLIGRSFAVDTVIQMHDVDAFEDDVSAYPAVTVLRRCRQGPAVLARANGAFDSHEAQRLRSWSTQSSSTALRRPGITAARLPAWFPGEELWPSGDPARLSIVADLEKRFPLLEDQASGTRVGIGVASGADSVYLTKDTDLVEKERLLPLAMSTDTTSGQLSWQGTYLVNPWDNGRLVDLAWYPRLASYFNAHAATVQARHVAKKQPASWYRTIDRVDPALAGRPKLLLPDLKAAIHPVLDEGGLYPHHNLYFVVSDGWDIEVLGGLLLSEVANLFVGTYCVKMRGGCYRFQAQYLRRIRVPNREALSTSDRTELRRAFRERDVEAATATATRLYGISELPPSTWRQDHRRPSVTRATPDRGSSPGTAGIGRG